MGDFNIDVNTAGVEVDKLDVFGNIFNLTNLIKIETCCTESKKSTVDLFVSNRPLSFQKTRAIVILELATIINLFHLF